MGVKGRSSILKDKYMIKRREIRNAYIVCLVIMLVCVCLFMCSCHSTRYVPVETVRTETKYQDRLVRDSIHMKDSILMFIKGDTVFRGRWHTEYRNKLVRDTVNVTDTVKVAVPYPVEKELSKWQQFKLDAGGMALGGLALCCLAMVVWLVLQRYNKWRK